jgi:uncharacterized membrane protein YcaP (DUF421 family)
MTQEQAMTIPDLGSDLGSVALRTAIVYVFLVVGFRLAGKREAGQLSTLDLVVLLIIANAVQNAMVGQNTSLAAGLIAAAVILGLDRSIHMLTDRFRPLRQVIEGEPSILVRDGEILDGVLKREGISRDELGIALREHGMMDASEAAYVFLETNGQITVIPRPGGTDGAGGVERHAGLRRHGPGKLPRVPS